MLGAALNFSGQTEIVAIDLLGLLAISLLKKEGSQCMARRVHPSPGLDVLEIVIATDTFSQVLVRAIIIALVVFQFTIKHLLADCQNAMRRIVEESPLLRDFPERLVKAHALLIGFLEIPQEGLAYPFRVVVHCRCDWIQINVIG